MSDQVYAVMLALEGDTLLLPNIAVSEAVPRDRVQAPEAGMPAWFAGTLDWNNRRVPVLSFELLNGGEVSATRSRRERVAVVQSTGSHLPGAILGIVMQGHPHLVTLTRAAVRPGELRPGDQAELVMTRVRIASQDAAIPDLDAIEAVLARSTDFGGLGMRA